MKPPTLRRKSGRCTLCKLLTNMHVQSFALAFQHAGGVGRGRCACHETDGRCTTRAGSISAFLQAPEDASSQEISALAWHEIAHLPATREQDSQVSRSLSEETQPARNRCCSSLAAMIQATHRALQPATCRLPAASASGCQCALQHLQTCGTLALLHCCRHCCSAPAPATRPAPPMSVPGP